MRAVLKLEIVGDNYLQRKKLIETGRAPCPHIKEWIRILRYGRKQFRPWVARITGFHNQYGFVREFVTGMRDYTHANSIGSRGIYEYFALSPGIYEVNECVKLGKNRRYFIRVQDATITEIDRDEVLQCLSEC